MLPRRVWRRNLGEATDDTYVQLGKTTKKNTLNEPHTDGLLVLGLLRSSTRFRRSTNRDITIQPEDSNVGFI